MSAKRANEEGESQQTEKSEASPAFFPLLEVNRANAVGSALPST